jgi:hypothetical protein
MVMSTVHENVLRISAIFVILVTISKKFMFFMIYEGEYILYLFLRSYTRYIYTGNQDVLTTLINCSSSSRDRSVSLDCTDTSLLAKPVHRQNMQPCKWRTTDKLSLPAR